MKQKRRSTLIKARGSLTLHRSILDILDRRMIVWRNQNDAVMSVVVDGLPDDVRAELANHGAVFVDEL